MNGHLPLTRDTTVCGHLLEKLSQIDPAASLAKLTLQKFGVGTKMMNNRDMMTTLSFTYNIYHKVAFQMSQCCNQVDNYGHGML